MTDSTTDVVVAVNVALGTDYVLVRRLKGGLQSGAFELRDGDVRSVLKWNTDTSWAPRVHRAAQLVRRARAAGYPTPAWLAVGTTPAGSPYQLQEYVDGDALGDAAKVDRTLAEQLVAINRLQTGLVDDREANWSDYVHGVVFADWGGLWERVRGFDEQTAALLARLERLCEPVPLPTGDLVHGDLNVSNLLLAEGRIAAIVDIEAASGGSRAYDLVSLAGSAARDGAPAGVDEYLLDAALTAAGRAATAVYVAADFVGLAAWATEVSADSLGLLRNGTERMVGLLERV